MVSNHIMNVTDVQINSGSNHSSQNYVAQSDIHVEAKEVAEKSGDNTSAMEKQFINAIEKANQLQVGTTECQFSIHQQTKQVMIKIINSSTKEVIKEIPSEKILDMCATMCETAGLFVNKKI